MKLRFYSDFVVYLFPGLQTQKVESEDWASVQK